MACQSDSESTFTTGGGFSNIYEMPPWQQESHDAYFSSTILKPPYVNETKIGVNKGKYMQFPFPKFNSKGRGYPDVSLLGTFAQILLHYEYLF